MKRTLFLYIALISPLVGHAKFLPESQLKMKFTDRLYQEMVEVQCLHIQKDLGLSLQGVLTRDGRRHYTWLPCGKMGKQEYKKINGNRHDRQSVPIRPRQYENRNISKEVSRYHLTGKQKKCVDQQVQVIQEALVSRNNEVLLDLIFDVENLSKQITDVPEQIQDYSQAFGVYIPSETKPRLYIRSFYHRPQEKCSIIPAERLRKMIDGETNLDGMPLDYELFTDEIREIYIHETLKEFSYSQWE